MSQQELLNILKRKRKYLTEKELVRCSTCCQSSVHCKLKRLVKGKNVQVKKKRVNLGKYNKNKLVKHYRYRR